ncbi:MAG: DNA mismatch repair endonuclease MutL [Dehalococcoidia bacterium]|nr:DNA mismatch repair endonuclease MutL [Dehalococcoidia bacterium]
MSIKVLPPEVTSKIAAGEVIERPASVAKELIENSLDAGSSQITVEVGEGGVGFLRVADNGCGLSPTEAEIAIRRHATSKLSKLDDLEHISTLGFRGEALPSIAAVAEMDVLTRDEGSSAAACLHLEEGRVVSREKKSRPVGTTVTVRHLFRNFPARLKFLKSSATEAGHIASLVSQYALAFPEVKFEFIADGRISLRTPGDGDLRSAVAEVYGLDTAKKMLEVEGAAEMLYASGLASPPSVQRSTKSYLSFFVNRRYVRNSSLAKAVETAYEGLLMIGRHPVVVLNITLPPEEVDVNVHPTKLEVKFRNNQAVFRAVVKTLREAQEKAPVPRVGAGEEDALAGQLWDSWTGTTGQLPPLRMVGQLSSSYILAEGEDGLYLIDQHAAHERILFERILSQRAANKPVIQGMLEPLALELTPAQEQVMQRSDKLLEEFGFTIEPFGQRSYLVRSVPAVLNGSNLLETLKELLDELGSEQDASKRDIKAAQSLACHSAVLAGQALDADEMSNLIRQLQQTSSPRTCPHGRPTMIHLSSTQLKKEFGRAG